MRCSGPRLGPLPDTTGLLQTTASGTGVRVESFTSPVDSDVSLVRIAPQAAAAGGQTLRSLSTFAGPAIVHLHPAPSPSPRAAAGATAWLGSTPART